VRDRAEILPRNCCKKNIKQKLTAWQIAAKARHRAQNKYLMNKEYRAVARPMYGIMILNFKKEDSYIYKTGTSIFISS
jgi:hypothetical protein